ncbi:MAG: RNA polymerase sigma factor [bacterium]|nr:RNA polymerase sigma factor [bacterium]
MTISQKNELSNFLNVAHEEYYQQLMARAFFKVNNRELSEDLVQDTFLKTWNYLVKGGKIEMMRAFLYHLLNNLIIDAYRKRKALSLDSLKEQGFEVSVDDRENLFSFLDGKEALLLIERLPENYRQIMHLRYIEDAPLMEISEITGKSPNCVSVQIHRGLKLIQKMYKN